MKKNSDSAAHSRKEAWHFFSAPVDIALIDEAGVVHRNPVGLTLLDRNDGRVLDTTFTLAAPTPTDVTKFLIRAVAKHGKPDILLCDLAASLHGADGNPTALYCDPHGPANSLRRC